MKYQTLSSAEARRILAARRSQTPDIESGLGQWNGEGEELDQSFVDGLRKALNALMLRFGSTRSDKENSEFEGEAAIVVHKLIPYEPLILSDFGFWTWLAVLHLPEMVEWRYGNPEGGTDLKNYGVGARAENLIYRLWLRAEISLDESSKDRYHLTKRGQVDFWRSHLIRQGYASVPAMARALVRFQYPEKFNGAPRLKISEIRALAPRMKRLRANLMYEFLSEDACLRLLERESSVLVKA